MGPSERDRQKTQLAHFASNVASFASVWRDRNA